MAGGRDCDKRHVRLVQALRSALLGVKTDMTLCNLQAPRSNCAVAKEPKEKFAAFYWREMKRTRPAFQTGSFHLHQMVTEKCYLRVKSVLENLAEGLCVVLRFPGLGGEQYGGLDSLRHGLTHQLSRELHSPTQSTRVRNKTTVALLHFSPQEKRDKVKVSMPWISMTADLASIVLPLKPLRPVKINPDFYGLKHSVAVKSRFWLVRRCLFNFYNKRQITDLCKCPCSVFVHLRAHVQQIFNMIQAW